MKERIDPLIAERAPWLYSGKLGTRRAQQILEIMLGYRQTVDLGQALRDLPALDIMDKMARLIAKDVEISGLENLPKTGPALLVANHPTGIADGIILWSAISRIRRDAYFFANSDINRVLPQMTDIICPVEWRPEKRSRAKTRETLSYTAKAMDDGRLGIVFPSGRLAKRHRLTLSERPWMASAVSIARKYDVPLVPLHIRARNSVLFYLFDAIHPTLRDITLFHETLNKGHQPFRMTMGNVVLPKNLPQDTGDALARLRKETLKLGDDLKDADVSLIRASRQLRLSRNQVMPN